MKGIPDWLYEFYAADHVVDVDRLLNDGYGPLSAMVKPALSVNEAFVLPENRMSSSSQVESWFLLVVNNHEKLVEFRTYLHAALGTAYTDAPINLVTASKQANHKALLKAFPKGFLEFKILDSYKSDKRAKLFIWSTINQVLQMEKRRPKHVQVYKRPLGRILRDFNTAYLANQSEQVAQFLVEIEASQQISPRNLYCLQIQSGYVSGNFRDVLDHPFLAELLLSKLPRRISSILFYSLVTEFIVDEEYRLKGDLYAYKELFNQYHQLFSLERCPNLLNLTDEHNSLLTECWHKGREILGVDSYTSGKAQTGGVVATSKSRMAVPESISEAQSLIKEHIFSESHIAKKVCDLLESMPVEMQVEMRALNTIVGIWDVLKTNANEHNRCWQTWIADLNSPEASPRSLENELQASASNWQVENFDESAFADTLQMTFSADSSQVIRNAIPLFITWVRDNGITISARTWVQLVELLALDEQISSTDLTLVAQIGESFLQSSINEQQYINFMDATEIVIDKVKSTATLGSVISTFEVLLSGICAEESIRVNLWLMIQGFALKIWSRLNPLEQNLVKTISFELLGDSSVDYFAKVRESENVIQDDLVSSFDGKTLAIYTLDQGAGVRAKQTILLSYPNLNIEINDDHAATQKLSHLAKKADFFIFAAQKSKHQAYYAIKHKRSDLIYQDGKGASSLVRSFYEKVVNSSM